MGRILAGSILLSVCRIVNKKDETTSLFLKERPDAEFRIRLCALTVTNPFPRREKTTLVLTRDTASVFGQGLTVRFQGSVMLETYSNLCVPESPKYGRVGHRQAMFRYTRLEVCGTRRFWKACWKASIIEYRLL